ncbi:FAD-binding oxidoreductase [Bradyrhizobium sp. Ce-3]|uniref:FAD-binding oxidoreductase n=1 Tax=Bradyrhizobium sp. Ce-3 TaxID=2913970 RepID=UPI001FC8C5AC|nr:FAD-linked oxidase C-terminal domain-containing protein [Bradyrhizobium sp. Ce-3]GKQ55127.1 lactate dehydrogenase [Bradyrhizobium sp. Ce-3]
MSGVMGAATREALKQIFGDRYSENSSVLASHAGTEAHHEAAPPDAVVWPRSTPEVVEAVLTCARAGVPVIAHGNGSSLEGNTAAVSGGLCIDLTQMNRVLRVSVEDLDCTVQAGVPREQLNAEIRDSGLFFPIDPGANATLGGMAATRASGTNAVRYGTMRENVLNLTVVTPQGDVIRTAGRARKSSAGYDLTRLHVGSEGTLGVITEVSLRLHGRPESVRSATCRFPDPISATRAATEAIQLGLPIARIEYLDEACIRAVNAFSNLQEAEADTLFLEFHGSTQSVQEQVALFGEIANNNGGIDFRWAERDEDRNRLWAARHSAYKAVVSRRAGCRGWATDVCVPVSALPGSIAHAKSLLSQCTVPAAIMGHVGDGNFHVVFSVDTSSASELSQIAAINDALVARALASEGTCTGEHGVGIGKMKYMNAEHGPALDIMRRIKAALDPRDIMNPGKIIPSI